MSLFFRLFLSVAGYLAYKNIKNMKVNDFNITSFLDDFSHSDKLNEQVLFLNVHGL